MKQTAVEWLANRIIDLEERLRLKEINLNDFIEEKDLLVDQAKEMGKQEIINAWDDGYDKGTRDRLEKISNPVGNAEQYYNKTFKSE